MSESKFSEWGLLEIMGHQRYAGLIGEQSIAGSGYIRVDVPKTAGAEAFTKFFAPGSVFGITPLDEQIARAMANDMQSRPVSAYDIRSLMSEVRHELRESAAREAEYDRRRQALLPFPGQGESRHDDDGPY